MTKARPTAYITGKITGLSEEEYKRLFGEAAEFLNAEGFQPVNPLEVRPECGETCDSGLTFENGAYQHHWQCYMKHDIIEMLKCDFIFPLANAKESKGAQIEIELASRVGIPMLLRDNTTRNNYHDWKEFDL
jgi:hypothetical protein